MVMHARDGMHCPNQYTAFNVGKAIEMREDAIESVVRETELFIPATTCFLSFPIAIASCAKCRSVLCDGLPSLSMVGSVSHVDVKQIARFVGSDWGAFGDGKWARPGAEATECFDTWGEVTPPAFR